LNNHDPPERKGDVAEFGDRTTSHSANATPEPKSKDRNMTDTTMKSLAGNQPKSSTMPSFWAYKGRQWAPQRV